MVSGKQYDVAVIGAGPSGAQTAFRLAEAGWKVAVFEEDAKPGLPVHCTGIVSAECYERYQLPESLVIRPITSFVLRSPSGQPTPVRKRHTQAYVLDRILLDQFLTERAVNAGAALFTSHSVKEAIWTGHSVEISGLYSMRQTSFNVKCRAAVIATGFGSRLARNLNLSSNSQAISGYQAVVDGCDAETVEVFTGSAFGKGGFGWIVPWQGGLALTGILTRKNTTRIFEKHLEHLRDQRRFAAIQSSFRLRGVPIAPANRTYADGMLAVGDVAGQVKPTSGGGIYFGMLSADMAATTLNAALVGGDTSSAYLSGYEAAWRKVLAPEIYQGAALRSVLEQLPDGIIENMHKLLSLPGLRRVLLAAGPSFDWHSGPLTRLLALIKRRSDPTSSDPIKDPSFLR